MSIEEQMASLKFIEAGNLNQPKPDATPNEMILSTAKEVSTHTSKTTIFDLPLELRQMIYEEVYETGWFPSAIFDWNELGLYYFKNSFPGIQLSRVCRQFYHEVTPYIYKRVVLSLPLEDWDRFFSIIGPHNIRHIQEMKFRYKCSVWGGAWDCRGRDSCKDNYNKWEGIFQSLIQGNVNPKSISVHFDPCDDDPRTEDGTPIYGYQYHRCQVYEDMWFIKGVLRCFRQARTIEFRGRFNPLWGHVLHQGLGFILRRHGDGRMVLFNPEFIRRSIDLKDCVEARSGIYDKIQKPWPQLAW
ncbi:hypothetical protein F4814DRAFT_455465 [Daldinia grandis]|nr:hypothetical protein F4814DRAFT_455465 [Daldinia grandis]